MSLDLKLADFTTKCDCRLTRVAVMRELRQEFHFCVTCRATLVIDIGEQPVCPVRRLLNYQRSRAANDASPSRGDSLTKAPAASPAGDGGVESALRSNLTEYQ